MEVQTAQKKSKPAGRRSRGRLHEGQHANVQSILHANRIQPKLRVGQPNDKYEQEADRVAEQIVKPSVDLQKFQESQHKKTPDLHTVDNKSAGALTTKNTAVDIQRVCAQCEEEVQLKPDEEQDSTCYDDPFWLQNNLNLRSDGHALANRSFFESRFACNFDDIRIYTNSKAQDIATSLGARALTHGTNIYFSAGEYQPHTLSGKKLIAHELTHTLQQRSGTSLIQRACGDAGCEATDPDTPDCPNPEDFLLEPSLEAIRESIFAGSGNLFIIERGDSGVAVALIQRLLLNSNCSGYDRAGVRTELVSQNFGTHTDDAVEQFQASHNDANGLPLVVDGDVGPATLSAMDIILDLEPVGPTADPEELGQCFGAAEDGPGEARQLAATEILPVPPFFPAFKTWELSNFDIDESFVKTEHRGFIRETMLPALRLAEEEFPDADDMHFRLVGEASTTASDTYNLGLSARRTHCVRETLIDEGISAENIRDHSASALGESLAKLRRTVAGLPADNVEDRHARKVTVILDVSAGTNESDDCDDADKTLASSIFKAKIACAGSTAMRINIGNFGNPSQPVYREFIWQQFPLFDGCLFQLSDFTALFNPVNTDIDLQLAKRNPNDAAAHSDFQGSVVLKTVTSNSFLEKEAAASIVPWQILLRGVWNEEHCADEYANVPGVMRPIGPVKCGVVPAPPSIENCYPSSSEEDCSDEVRQAAAQEFVATMVRISGDPAEALKQIKRIAKVVAVLDWILDFLGVQALLGGAAVVIGSQDLQQPILRPFLFLGGGIGGAAEEPLGGNLLVSDSFTLDNPKQLETDVSGLLLNGSDFTGSASITIVGSTNREELTIDGNGFSQTIPMWGLSCDGGASRTAHGRLISVANAKCLSLPETPHIERECEDDCSENLRLSGFNDFTIKVGRASYSAVPGVAQHIADGLGGCGATMAFINVGNRVEEEGEATVFRKFVFVGRNTNCAFTVARGEDRPSYFIEKHLAYGDPEDRFAFSDFAGIAQVNTSKRLRIVDVPPTDFQLPGSYEANCDNGSIMGVVFPISEVECGELPDTPHITIPDPDDAERCNAFKADNAPLVNANIAKLGTDYLDVLDTIVVGPALRYPNYHHLFLQVGETINNATFVGKTIADEPVVSFLDMEVVSGERTPAGFYIFRVNILTQPCSFNAAGEAVLIKPENCREGFIQVGEGTIFPVLDRPVLPGLPTISEQSDSVDTRQTTVASDDDSPPGQLS